MPSNGGSFADVAALLGLSAEEVVVLAGPDGFEQPASTAADATSTATSAPDVAPLALNIDTWEGPRGYCETSGAREQPRDGASLRTAALEHQISARADACGLPSAYASRRHDCLR